MRRRAAVAAVALALVIVPSCARGDDEASAPALIEIDPASTSPTDQAIVEAQARLVDVPEDDGARLALANALLQRAREIGDPSMYDAADAHLDVLEERRGDEVEVLVARGTLSMARHRFADAHELATRAVRVAPESASALGLLADAANERGRYDEALDAAQAMVDLRPDLNSLARVSYARELRGDLDGAIGAMEQAVANGSAGENTAYIQIQLAQLLVTRGDHGEAERVLADAERAFPGLVATDVARARLAIARDELRDARSLLDAAVEAQPTMENVSLLADVLTAAGDDDRAERVIQLFREVAEAEAVSGVDVDVDLALFAANHDPGDDAVTRAERAIEARPNLHGQDALAWALHTAGRSDDAFEVMEEALALGSRDPQIRFHGAVIAEAVGRRQIAREHLEVVLDTNPRFSARLFDTVERLARELELASPS